MNHLKTIREWLTIILITLLPFHAFAVTVLTRIVTDQYVAPLSAIALWKEALLGIILIIAIVEIGLAIFRNDRDAFHIDLIDGLIIGLILIAFVLFTLGIPGRMTEVIYGIRYDFVPLIAFLIARRVDWSERFKNIMPEIILIIAMIICLYGLLTLALPQSYFTALGYSDLHSLYIPDRPIAAFQMIGGLDVRRIQSVMSGPNHLGLWLLIPWSIALLGIVSSIVSKNRKKMWMFIAAALVIDITFFFTFSRSAWIAASIIFILIAWDVLTFIASKRTRMMTLGSIGVLIPAIVGAALWIAPDIVLRTASTTEHYQRAKQAIAWISDYPLGLGLGTAGPASNRTSDTCVFLEEGADTSWANAHPELCIFTGISPVEAESQSRCKCPLLPENWYLQLGIELGILGMIVFMSLIGLILYRLPKDRWIFYAFLGISISALFLHAWEDSAVAYTLWTIIAYSILRQKKGYSR